MVLLGAVGQVEPCFGLFEDNVNLGGRLVHCTKWTTGMGIILGTPLVLLGDVGKWKLVLVCLEIELISAHDRCTVCAECTTSMEITLSTTNGTPR
jgi:hypothetical protein